MTKSKLQVLKYKLVYIEWEDSLITSNKWVWDDEIDYKSFDKQAIHISVGFLVKETKKGMYLSQSSKKKEDDGSYSVAYPMYIPKSAIRRRKLLK
jgi:hypothetical protein